MALNIDELSTELFEYLKDVIELSPENIRTVKTALSMIREMSPSDIPNILRKIERLIDVSQDMAWINLAMKRKLHEMTREIKMKKDPQYVMLVKQGRPSSAAIEAEIRFTNKDMYDSENGIDVLNNVIEYFNKINESIEKYIWLLKDKLNSGK